MHLSNLKLWNFRKFGTPVELDASKQPNLSLDFSTGLNVIIGENDSGKTAIIDAIKLVLKTHSYEYIKVENSDFFDNTNRFRIELVFTGFEPEEAKNFTEWLGYETIDSKIVTYLRVIFDVRKDGQKILPADVKAGVDEDCYILTAEAREYLKATYLKPLRDAENELIAKRNSRLSQILLGDATFKGKEKSHDLVKLFQVLNKNLTDYFKGTFEIVTKEEDGITEKKHLPQDGKRIKDSIDIHVKQFHGKKHESHFNASPNDIKAILEKLSLSLINEQHPGLGTLNRLFMAAELLHLNKKEWSGIRLGLIEELEAHLHPQAQMQVIEALQSQDKIQLILTTHSPNLASKLKIENLIICQQGKAYPMGDDYTRLEKDDYKFLEKFLDTTKANLFFAKGIILVEGWAEEILIPSIAKSIGVNLTEAGISIVNVGNLALDRYSKIFLRKTGSAMEMPIAIVTDPDVRAYSRNKKPDGKYEYYKVEEDQFKKDTANKIKDIERLSVANVKYFPAKIWTLEYSLFKSTSLTKSFIAETTKIHSGQEWKDDFEYNLGKSLINKVLHKTEIAYNLALSIDKDISNNVFIDATDDSDTISYILNAIKYAAGI
ncbi:ATP-dependent endonuclease [Mucilaginibacter sp. PAMC 26640]|nr:ATP-dependent endonuclease [Mucilaginibacter sp. PAMC 26640]